MVGGGSESWRRAGLTLKRVGCLSRNGVMDGRGARRVEEWVGKYLQSTYITVGGKIEE